jgi:hypothetical protein
VVRTPPANGTLVHAGSSFTYVPNTGFGGVDTFTAAAGDGLLSTPFTVTVAVTVAAPLAAPAPEPTVESAGAVQPAAATAPAARTLATASAPAIPLLAGSATMARGTVSIRLRCPTSDTACTGSARLSATLRGRLRSLGTRAVTLAAGESASIRVSIPPATSAALRGLAGRTIPLRVVVMDDTPRRVLAVTRLRVSR